MLLSLPRDRVRELVDECLGRRVDREHGGRVSARCRADVDDCALLLRDKGGKHRACHLHGTLAVNPAHVRLQLRVYIAQGEGQLVAHSDIVDEDAQPSQRWQLVLHQLLEVRVELGGAIEVGEIVRHDLACDTRVFLFDSFRLRLQLGRVSRDEHDVHALAREDVGKALAQTARAASDDRPSAVHLRVSHLPAQLSLQNLNKLKRHVARRGEPERA
mmetsp:Transcript_82935/g.234274  ORF Transcript_82935/g.234274 Transcript_82935/m.234274 type:complete len:216 (-) Transcript_82935:328-975(-)